MTCIFYRRHRRRLCGCAYWVWTGSLNEKPVCMKPGSRKGKDCKAMEEAP
jgi:hypothetical protein